MKFTSASTAFSMATSLMMFSKSNIFAAAQEEGEQITFTGTITVTNVAPENGTCQSPVFVGIHDGTFDIYDMGAPISATAERLVEDGNSGPLLESFLADDAAAFGGRVSDGPICTGESPSIPFEVTATVGQPLFFSFGTMVLPSNDAFLSNDDPMEYQIVNRRGNFNELSITLFGNDVLDAGSEINSEVPEFTAFIGQMVPDAGPAQNSVVTQHPGHMPVGSGGILDDPRFVNADFTAFRFRMLEISVVLDEDEDDSGNLFFGRLRGNGGN